MDWRHMNEQSRGCADLLVVRRVIGTRTHGTVIEGSRGTERNLEGGRDLQLLGERSMEWEVHGRRLWRTGVAGVEARGRSEGMYAVGAVAEVVL